MFYTAAQPEMENMACFLTIQNVLLSSSARNGKYGLISDNSECLYSSSDRNGKYALISDNSECFIKQLSQKWENLD